VHPSLRKEIRDFDVVDDPSEFAGDLPASLLSDEVWAYLVQS
jgi:hypothetical protein